MKVLHVIEVRPRVLGNRWFVVDLESTGAPREFRQLERVRGKGREWNLMSVDRSGNEGQPFLRLSLSGSEAPKVGEDLSFQGMEHSSGDALWLSYKHMRVISDILKQIQRMSKGGQDLVQAQDKILRYAQTLSTDREWADLMKKLEDTVGWGMDAKTVDP